MSFDTLRPWNGEQSRAFEELAYQLLKTRVPAGARAIRTGNPDGGVEWYATLPDSTEWGWQAKHVKGIDALLTAMTGSVERVAKERPELRKLTFVISWNLATGTAGNERKSQRQKYEDKIAVWHRTIRGAAHIAFDLVQESDLLDELSKPEHKGRRWFWWNQLVFGDEWLQQRFREQADAAGQKYRPDLQVDVPIQEDLLALGFDRSIVEAFDRLRLDVLTAVNELDAMPPEHGDERAASLYEAVRSAAAALKQDATVLMLRPDNTPAALGPLSDRLTACRQAIDASEAYHSKATAERRALNANDPRNAIEQAHPSRYRARELRRAISALESWLESSVGQALQRRAYFLSGQAGSGKTHLLLDATRRALAAKRPGVFLAGARFGRGNLWASVADQLGLDSVGGDDLLHAMDAAGEAASLAGNRFLIFVDALNETTPAEFWRDHLPALRAAVARYPHVALAVACRDTYVDLVLDDTESDFYVQRTHPGFADREVEATHRYFEHYGLEAPRIPLLTPEFTLPLFLRMYCESVSQGESKSLPAGHQGRVAIFERYMAAKVSMVAKRFKRDVTSSYELAAVKAQVRTVVESLLDEMARRGSESIPAPAAEEVARGALQDPGSEARLIGLLQEEGVLTRELLFLENGGTEEGVRIVFQAFADFLLLKRRLAGSPDPVADESLKRWLETECSWGIREAATILFPERFGVELPDLLGLRLTDERELEEEDAAVRARVYRTRQTYRSLVETLPYRDSRAISQRTIELLNEAQPYLSRDELYRVLFIMSPQLGNRLNGEGLHRYLLRYAMPRRDSDFGFATYHQLSDAFSPAARLARWAAAGPYPTYDSEVVELASIPLCWLLSSPNRYMRDWVTKALVQLLRGHLDVMRALVTRFWTIDDPYVVQRVIAIAYGALLRSSPAQAHQARGLAEVVRDLVFTRPIRADELLLDAGRGIVRWATTSGLLPEHSLELTKRPYGLKRPGPPPSEASFEAKYGWRKDEPPEKSYSAIRLSLLTMGDFGRYVVEPGLHHFSRYRIGQAYPNPEPTKPRVVKSRWRTFVRSLTEGQRRALAGRLDSPDSLRISRIPIRLTGKDDLLSEEQSELLDSVFVYPKPVLHEYPASGAKRWLFRRTLSLGWTPELFGREDRVVGHGRGREGHKAERWGKKYQWMAYHELLARVADNYQPSRLHSDSEAYEGLHQIIGDREIDPSLPPIDFRAFTENDGRDASAWTAPSMQLIEWPPKRVNFARYRGEVSRFLADTQSEPTVASALFLRDRTGSDWVVLESYTTQVDPLAEKGWRGLQQNGSVTTLLTPAADAQMLLAALATEPGRALREYADSHGHTDCCYIGEVGRAFGPRCWYRRDAFQQIDVGGRAFTVIPASEHYTWEGGILDCSIEESATAVLPSTYVQRATSLSFDMRGPSWVDANGQPAFAHYWEPGNGSHALLVKASYLRSFLAERDLAVIVSHWFHRMRLGDDDGRERAYVERSTHALLSATLDLQEWRQDRRQ